MTSLVGPPLQDTFSKLLPDPTDDNVKQAIEQIRPFAVDVLSGVESAKGIKDHEKISSFIRAVRAADSEVNGER